MAKAQPDLFRAYVGVGQLVSYRNNQSASYAKLIALARAAGDKETLGRIEALGPPPWTNPRAFGILRRATRAYEAKSAMPAPKGWWVPAAHYASREAEADYEAGEEYSYIQFVGMKGDGMYAGVELDRLGRRFEVPMYFIQGAEDLVTTPEVARAFFVRLLAPRKEFVLVERTGHDPNQASVDAVYAILKKDAARTAQVRRP
jgi:pimeloyl-ACP methyl ester carboxylesterase